VTGGVVGGCFSSLLIGETLAAQGDALALRRVEIVRLAR
jgi:hypothetical protein